MASGTGSYLFEASTGLYNEVQPGSYIFMDVDYSKNLQVSKSICYVPLVFVSPGAFCRPHATALSS